MARIIVVALWVLTISLRATGQQAGPDQTTCRFGLVNMAAHGTGTWSAPGTNPASTTIINPADSGTAVFGFAASGIYSFVWTSGGTPDTMTVTIIDADISSISASPDSIVQSGQSTTLSAQTDVAGGSYQWTPQAFITPVPGHPEQIIATPNITMNFCLNYTISGCQTTKCQTIYVKATYAGQDQTTCQCSAATMAAHGTGTWSALPINPTATIFANPSDSGTTVSGLVIAGAYFFVWTNGNGADTMTVYVNAKPDAGPDQVIFAGGTATMAAVGTGIWTSDSGNPGATTVNAPSSPATAITGFAVTGDYSFIWTSNGCTDTVIVSVQNAAAPDSVWPGDADHDGIADNNDLLPIGVAYGLNGFTRADQSIIWSAHYTQDWGLQFLNGTNAKHADCNGDGVVDANDTVAIIQNFGLTHAKVNGPGPWRAGLAGLKAILSTDSLYAGDTLSVTFVLGDATLPADSIYGLAWTYNFDPLVVDSSFTTMTFGSSWIGSTDKISISKILNNTGQIKAAMTRIDHTTRSGSGPVARASFKITTDNISGKDLRYYNNTGWISDITAIDQHGNPIQLNAGADTSRIGYTPAGISDIATEKVHLYPNPAHDQVTISAGSIIDEISITNVAGQEILHQRNLNSKATGINVSALDDGAYFIQIKTDNGRGSAKLFILK